MESLFSLTNEDGQVLRPQSSTCCSEACCNILTSHSWHGWTAVLVSLGLRISQDLGLSLLIGIVQGKLGQFITLQDPVMGYEMSPKGACVRQCNKV